MLDVAPESRILTVQNRRPPAASIRLQGSTIKVWTAGSLFNQRPLLVVHDVVKHFQLEDGRLFLWRIADDAFVAVRSTSNPTTQNENQNQNQPKWAEHESLVASLLDPVSLTVTNLPLESTYGRGRCPYEWMDMGTGCVAAAFIAPVANEMVIHVRLFDFLTGRCFKESSCVMPQAPEAEGIFPPLSPEGAGMLLSRNSDAEYQVLATAVLYDFRVFRWRLKDFETGPCGVANGCANTNESETQYSLHHIFTTPSFEPITDVSISTTAGRIYVLGLENLHILGQNGVLQQSCSMLSWRGVDVNFIDQQNMLGADVGAFSWPLPNSTRTAFYLDITNSLFLCDFRAPNFMEQQFLNGSWLPHSRDNGNYRFPPVDHLVSWARMEGGGVRSCPFYMQSHVDLRPPPRRAASSAISGRLTRPPDSDPVVVEYVQSGEILMTLGDSICPATAALLRSERTAKTYVEGLGPSSTTTTRRQRLQQSTAQSTRRGQKAKSNIAPRALILIDTATGERFKAIPVDGTLEAAHSAGHYVVMTVAELESYPDGPSGALIVLDFSGQGFGSNLNPVYDASQKRKRKKNDPISVSSSPSSRLRHSDNNNSNSKMPAHRRHLNDGIAPRNAKERSRRSYKSRRNPIEKQPDDPDTN